jgi:hypothetical protein
MLRLIRVVIVLGLLWSAYWYIAGFGLRSGIEGWFITQSERGWQADYATIETSGYPTRHRTMLTSPALADPATGTAWQGDWLELDSPAIWPGRQTLRFAATPQRFSYFDRTLVIEAQDMQADFHLHPGIALALDRLALTAGAWSISGPKGPVANADDLTLSMVQTEQAETYEITINAADFTPGEEIRRILASSTVLPRSFDALKLDTAIQFDKQWDRSALEEKRPQPVAIDLKLAELHWGELRLFAAGKLDVDAQGIPTGEIALKAENWREMLAMAEAAGAIPRQAVDPAERVLNMLASLGGNPSALDVQLNFRDGFVALGPLPIGPAPRLILR